MMTDFKSPVLVSGGSGYLASHIIKQLMDNGYTVHTTVRDKRKTDKYDHLLRLAEQSRGELKVFEADLLKRGSFGEAMKTCSHVFHTASPFKIGKIRKPKEVLVEPALEGTRNILETANNTKTVERLVLTSSIVAIMGDAIDAKNIPGGVFTEDVWNTTSNLDHQPYPYSKTLAEKEAWKIVGEQSRWSLLVMNPGFILGPSLTKRADSTSISFMISMGNGTYKTGVPGGYLAIVDVRDAARAHILGAFNEKSSGRHILTNEHLTFWDAAKILKKKFPAYPLPVRKVPKWLFIIIGPMFGLTRQYIRKNIGHPLKFDNTYSIRDLGIDYRPAEQTLKDHFRQLIDDGLLPLK